jgi:L-serine dehydratase
MTQPRTLSAFLELAQKHGHPLSKIFLEYEMKSSGQSLEALRKTMADRLGVMRSALERGLQQPQLSRSGLVQGDAQRMSVWIDAGKSLIAPAFSRMVAAALAVAEVNACMGRIVAAPTAGSCGVLPAVLLVMAQERGFSDDALVDALFTAGGIGLVIENQASLSGAEGGCQAEVGSASAMAAGALVELMGGSPDDVGHAVAFALANLMGLICDPVQGLVEVPCVRRNAMGAVNALTSAEMALSGQKSVFSADQVIETMGNVGRRLPEEFRETARGGLALLPCAGCSSQSSRS